MASRAYVTRIIPQPGIDRLREHLEVDVNEQDRQLGPEELAEKASQYDALVTLLTDRIDDPVLRAGAGHLKIVANVAVGFDNIDVDAASRAGVAVTNTPGVLTDTTADFAWALLMAVSRRVCESQSFLRAGKFSGWGIMLMLGGDVYRKRLGLVGFGRIGQAVARRASGFDMDVVFYDPTPEAADAGRRLGARAVDLDELLRTSDFVSLHTPLTPETHHLIGSQQLSSMKNSAYLINTARGPIVDEEALAQALKGGAIAGAALDVFENEPSVNAALLDAPNALLTPHVASASVETRTRMAEIAAENVIAAIEGRTPPNALNADGLQR